MDSLALFEFFGTKAGCVIEVTLVGKQAQALCRASCWSAPGYTSMAL